MKICTEADYLQAHLTIIQGKSRATYPTLQIDLQRLASRLRKWIVSNARLHSRHFVELSRRTRKSSLAPLRKCKGKL